MREAHCRVAALTGTTGTHPPNIPRHLAQGQAGVLSGRAEKEESTHVDHVLKARWRVSKNE